MKTIQTIKQYTLRSLTVFMMVFAAAFTGMQVAAPASVSAAEPTRCTSSFFGLPAWHKYLPKDTNCRVVDFCFLDSSEKSSGGDCSRSSVPLIILAIIEIALRIGALIAVAFVIVGGFKFVTSQGEPDGVRSARNTILNALIGLVITILATPLVSFIANRFG